MRIITKEIEVYEFHELPKEVKECAINNIFKVRPDLWFLVKSVKEALELIKVDEYWFTIDGEVFEDE